MDKGKGKEFIIDLNDEDFDYQYDSIVKTESDEEAILVSDKIFNDLTVEDVWKMEFSSVEEAEEFYNLFAKVTGFSVRKDDVKRDKNQNIVSRTSQIMDYMVQQSGGYNNVGFTKKDLYNHVDADRRVHLRDGDAEGALAYLCGKSEMDPSFYYKYNVDEDNRLANLFWADSTSKLDYSCFGDVLAFDTTYRTNAYKKPLVILVGINHHHQTIVFGCALLVDESVSTYTWVLETFLDAMNNKKPLSVITDGDKAMRKAIKRIFPDSCHRLCAWHIQRNAFTNVHVKDFTNHFSKCMFMEGTVEEFECAWNDMLEMFNLHGHNTQRCESMNAYLNRFLKTRLKLFEFVKHFDRALSRIRHNEAKAEFETHHSSAVLTTKLYALEKYAGTVFTRQSFLKFRDEMKNAIVFPFGFPCPHMIVVMKIEHLEEIPETCIMKRWSKLAKETVQVHHDNESQGDATNIIRYGALSSMCSRMSYLHLNRKKLLKRLDVKYKDSLVKWKNFVKIQKKVNEKI
ncbi:Protein FAR1-related sequence 5 [Vitis vinifera]|uniref:Protein FAR1-related sequence 5 n=1 Tax=Vitis vinifera TaxID=29760 RepID=A0A438HQ60_VITVI|nr:Protein FAR1-related sequence 5 [Vitis vinifera]